VENILSTSNTFNQPNCIIVEGLTSLQHTAKTGAAILCMDFGTVLPDCSTSQQRTLQSQEPATRKFCCMDAGLNARLETESSGGETTSKSCIGFDVFDVPVLNELL